MSQIEKLERIHTRYGVNIVIDGTDNRGRPQYAIYTADNCKWENGLSFTGVCREAKEWGQKWLEIAKGGN